MCGAEGRGKGRVGEGKEGKGREGKGREEKRRSVRTNKNASQVLKIKNYPYR